MNILINGIEYEKIEHKPTKHSRKLSAIMSFAMAVGGFDRSMGKKKERPKVDIIKEFELIQQKKSGLSKSQRDWVEWQFHMNFKIVKK